MRHSANMLLNVWWVLPCLYTVCIKKSSLIEISFCYDINAWTQVRNVQNIILIILLLKTVNRREGVDSLELQYNSLSMLVKVYARIRSFIVMCVLCFCDIRQ